MTDLDDPVPRARRRKPRTGRIKGATIRLHRWLSFGLGLLLLVITTTGAAVVYSPEWTRWTNTSEFEVPRSDHPISMTKAIAVVDEAHPTFEPGAVNLYRGLYEVTSTDEEAHPGFWGVDPGTGRITGYVNPNRGFMALMDQVHECFFTCPTYPAYAPFLDHPVPTLGMHWLKDVTWGGFTLGVMGLLLVFLAVSGIWLWWPGIKRLAHGFRIRTKKGRFARDYDLHQVVGMVALPFLLIWGVTGASFELHWVNTAWYAVTGGQQVPDVEFASKEVKGKAPADIGLDAAIEVSRTKARPDAELVYASAPAADDPTAYYDLWYSERLDQYQYGAYPGQYEVQVDRHDASHTAVNDYGTAPTLSNKVLDSLGGPTFHFGQTVNPWWRMLWFLFGLTPLVLAITGISTWLAKHSARKRRKAVLAARAAEAPPTP